RRVPAMQWRLGTPRRHERPSCIREEEPAEERASRGHWQCAHQCEKETSLGDIQENLRCHWGNVANDLIFAESRLRCRRPRPCPRCFLVSFFEDDDENEDEDERSTRV